MNNRRSYHEGELATQGRAGVVSGDVLAEEMYRAGMPSGVQRFLSIQQLAVLSSIDGEGRVWASMRTGAPGFLRALDENTVEIGGFSHPDDPLLANLAGPSEVGMLVIHLAARHRVRLNGIAQLRPDGRILLTTLQVYGNCPQYIQARAVVDDRPASSASGPARSAKALDQKMRDCIEQADTFFLATAHPQAGADASHRGGKPGFVRTESPTRLIFPDYSGNKMFNSLGNIAVYPHAGLLFPDFQSGSAVQLSGSTQILWDDPRQKQFTGAQRLLQFDIERVIELPQATSLRFEFRGYSPHLR